MNDWIDRHALTLQPLHPEAHGLLAELLGHRNQLTDMAQAITAAADRFDELLSANANVSKGGGGLEQSGMTAHSLASVFHKLATCFLAVSQSVSH